MIAFELSMPGVGSWDDRWSGEGLRYVIVRRLPATGKNYDLEQRLIAGSPYRHPFGDGWVAAVSVSHVDAAEARKLRKQSAGFCGYDWMIDSLLENEEIRSPSHA
jgi:hypothetical protein